ncbi:MAG: isoprenylcysteine carboxylmethyltransferase family protein [Betaproteobacteria bacterium]|nr:isoprenylcysteine carboxylmethyltransferase family protein [Betaproteobacteria bacterium]
MDTPVQLSRIEKAGEILFRLRDYTPVPIILLAILFAQPTLTSLFVGGFVALIGEFLRTYGVAYIGTISRTRSYSNGQLVQEGPFALLRNPLYFGNLVLSVGLALMCNVSWLPILVIVVFYAQYIPVVAWEERKLTHIFGDAYARYCATVPNRWFPSLQRIRAVSLYAAPQSWGPALKSEKRTLTSVVAYFTIMTCLFFVAQQGSAVLPLISKLTGN